ncbi:calcium-binding protein [Yoonia sp. R2-816]|uniref:calcium-binding protein n=1 Tax=Yoonia sp. R2-816 TaxID=3342638 RepID=UPI00372B7052
MIDSSEAVFTVTPDTQLRVLQAVTAADSPYDRVIFAPGEHSLDGTISVEKLGLTLDISAGATLTPTSDMAWMFKVNAPSVTITGSGVLDGGDIAAAQNFYGFIEVFDTADGFHVAGNGKPDQDNQEAALEFTNATVAVVVSGADNVVIENLYLHHFRPGTYGIILRDTSTSDGINADGGYGNIVRNLLAHDASGGAPPGNSPVNGAWIRLDTDEQGPDGVAPTLTDVQILDNILLGGEAMVAENGNTYFFVNVDSNVDAAKNVEIAYNTLADAASYEVQIKNGWDSPIGITGALIHHNIMDHSDTGLQRIWPMKLQSNFDSPFFATFENNLALLQPGLGPERLHIALGYMDDIGYNGDFQTDLFRTVIRTQDDASTLIGTATDEWIISTGAQSVTSGGGADLIEFTLGDGMVTITDFETGVDQIRLLGFGLVNLAAHLGGINGQEGFINFGNGDVLFIENNGEALDLSEFTSADVVVAQTFNTLFSNGGMVQGSEAADQFLGTAADDTVYGGNGGDLLFGEVGNDWLYGGDGNDRIMAGDGIDRMWGGHGADTFVFASQSQLNVIYDFELGTDRISLADGLSSEDLAITLYNGTDADIRTQSGDRLVLRNITPDQLDAADFVITALDNSGPLLGGANHDILLGSTFDDTLHTSGGTDRLYGYTGADTFVFNTGSGLNIVYDFEVGIDLIALPDLSVDALDIFMYNSTDVEMRADDGSRLVLRNVDISEMLDADSFLL